MKVESFNIVSEWDGKYRGFLTITDGEGSNATVIVPDALCREIIEANKWSFESLFSAKKFDYNSPCMYITVIPGPHIDPPAADDDLPF